MDNVNHLLEGASPYQVLQDQAGKLSAKWEKSGLLEGIESSTESNNMAILLENQAKQLVNEANSTGTGATFFVLEIPVAFEAIPKFSLRCFLELDFLTLFFTSF